MKVKVITEFIDKYNGKYNPVGAEIEITAERFEEISKAGNYVVPAESEAKPKKDGKKV